VGGGGREEHADFWNRRGPRWENMGAEFGSLSRVRGQFDGGEGRPMGSKLDGEEFEERSGMKTRSISRGSVILMGGTSKSAAGTLAWGGRNVSSAKKKFPEHGDCPAFKRELSYPSLEENQRGGGTTRAA